MTKCRAEDCDRRSLSWGCCDKHYRRLLKYGTLQIANLEPKRLAKFKRSYKINLKTGCWEWQGNVDSRGYGRHRSKNQDRKVHRLAWEFAYGKIPKGICVCHRCDNKICMNPSHLFLGTNQENQYDKVKKRRHARGEKNGAAKLTNEQARIIFYSSKPTKQLATEFKISCCQIHDIKAKRSWKCLWE